MGTEEKLALFSIPHLSTVGSSTKSSHASSTLPLAATTSGCLDRREILVLSSMGTQYIRCLAPLPLPVAESNPNLFCILQAIVNGEYLPVVPDPEAWLGDPESQSHPHVDHAVITPSWTCFMAQRAGGSSSTSPSLVWSLTVIPEVSHTMGNFITPPLINIFCKGICPHESSTKCHCQRVFYQIDHGVNWNWHESHGLGMESGGQSVCASYDK